MYHQLIVCFVSRQIFKGNSDNNSVVINSISKPVEARFVRFIPQSWKNSIALRVEVYGEVTGKLVTLLSMVGGFCRLAMEEFILYFSTSSMKKNTVLLTWFTNKYLTVQEQE